MVYPELPVTEAEDKYKDRFNRSRYNREDKETDDLRNTERKSLTDVYRFNGEDIKPKSENGNIDDNILLQLFKEQDTAGSPNKFSKLQPTLPSQNRHAHPYKPEASWLEMNYVSKMEGYQLPSQAPFAGTGITYDGGPNITPQYHKITGQLLESNKSYSSSSSGTDSSPTHSQNGRYETNCQIKDGQTESIRMGKDEKIAKEAGIRFNVKQDIVHPPMDEFNDMLSKEDLSEEQLNICRDIRRRGKNKVAAQNCRKRKIEQIDELQERLDEAKRRQYQLQANHEKLLSSYSSEASKLTRLTDTVLAHHNKNPHQYLVQVEGEEVKILPKSAVAEKDRIPRPISSVRPNYIPENYSTGSHSPNAREMYNTSNLEQCARRGWE